MLEILDLSCLDLNKVVGIDLGLKDFAIVSNGDSTVKIDNPKYYRETETKIKNVQKELSRKQLNSKNYNKVKEKLNKVHKKIKNQRTDFLHKESSKIINENQVIILEDLNIKGMVKNKRLAKSISDAAWYNFLSMLKYKASLQGKIVLQIDRIYQQHTTKVACLKHFQCFR